MKFFSATVKQQKIFFQADLWASGSGDKEEQKELPEAGTVSRRCNANNKQVLHVHELSFHTTLYYILALDVWDIFAFIFSSVYFRVTASSLCLWRGKHWWTSGLYMNSLRLPKSLKFVSRVASDMQGEMLPLCKIAVHVQNIFFLPATPLTETKCWFSWAELLLSVPFHGKQ